MTGLTIVVLHAFMDSGATWDMVAPALARGGHEVIAPDLRGFGLSDSVDPSGYYHFPDYVADVAQLVESLAPRRLALIGHSMGGTIAAMFSGAHPDLVERLALLEGLGPVVADPDVAVVRLQSWLRGLRDVPKLPRPLTSVQEAVERLCLHHPGVPREVIETRARLLTRADDTGRLVWAYDPRHRTTSPTPFNVGAFKAFLARIECPTLVVSGGPSGWHTPDEADRLSCLSHAVVCELPTAGHMMHWTQPVLLAQRLLAFFSAPPVPRTKPPTSVRPASGIDPSSSIGGHEPLTALEGPPPDGPTTTPGMLPPSVPPETRPRSATVPSGPGVQPVYGGAAVGLPSPGNTGPGRGG